MIIIIDSSNFLAEGRSTRFSLLFSFQQINNKGCEILILRMLSGFYKKILSVPTDDPLQEKKLDKHEVFVINVDIFLSSRYQDESIASCRIMIPKAPNSDISTWKTSYQSVMNTIETVTELKKGIKLTKISVFCEKQRILSGKDLCQMCNYHGSYDGTITLSAVMFTSILILSFPNIGAFSIEHRHVAYDLFCFVKCF